MTKWIAILLQWFRLTRFELAFVTISNSWLMVFVGYGLEPTHAQGEAIVSLPMWATLLLATLVAGGLHVYGTAINDVLDARHDRAFRPQAPIAAGQIAVPTAAIVAMLSLMLALLASVFLGRASILICLATATFILFFNATGKHLPATGLVSLSLIRVMSLFIINPRLSFVWPLLWLFTHTLVCQTLAYWLMSKRPRLLAWDWGQLIMGWLFWVSALVLWTRWQDGLAGAEVWQLMGWPLVAALGFAVLVTWQLSPRMRPLKTRRQAGRLLAERGLLWLIVYDMMWMIAAEQWGFALVHVLLLALAMGLSRLTEVVEEARVPLPGYQTH